MIHMYDDVQILSSWCPEGRRSGRGPTEVLQRQELEGREGGLGGGGVDTPMRITTKATEATANCKRYDPKNLNPKPYI